MDWGGVIGCHLSQCFIIVNIVYLSGGRIVLPIEGDGWSTEVGCVAEGYVVGTYFEVGEGDAVFETVLGGGGEGGGFGTFETGF